MSHNQQVSQHKQTFRFSFKSPNTDGAQNSTFDSKEYTADELLRLFTEHNYSPILWNGGDRRKSSFSSADGVILDFDHDIRIDDVLTKLESRALSYALITSKSHSPEAHRFHLFLPFSRPVASCSDFEVIVDALRQTDFTTSDPAATDGARFYYFSPADATYLSDFTRSALDVDALLRIADEMKLGRADSKGHNHKTYPPTLKLHLENGSEILASEVTEKTPILCPFHKDSNASAFVKFSDETGAQFIHCSSCDETFWMEQPSMAQRCDAFWSHADSYYEAGFSGMDFSFEKIGKDKLFLRAKIEKHEEDECVGLLAREKHLHSLGLREHHGSVDDVAPTYEVMPKEGKTIVRIPAILEDLADNAFIEEYLRRTFGQYTKFIKEYLAAYCFTNYKPLPTIILKGARGTGKNTFAEMVGEIFKSLSQPIADLAGSFNPYAEKKLGIVDETLRGGRMQYADLKKLSGQAEFEVNTKYKAQYKARNNLNLILLSNEKVPITVSAAEIPSDSRNNQFFVFEMKPFTGQINGSLATELRRRLGHYIRTELRTVYASLPPVGFRYSIDVPITQEERELFENNADDLAHLIEMMLDEVLAVLERRGGTRSANGTQILLSELAQKYEAFISKGYLPIEYLKEHLKGSKFNINSLRLRLQEHWCLAGHADRKTVDGVKKSCLSLDQTKIKDYLSKYWPKQPEFAERTLDIGVFELESPKRTPPDTSEEAKCPLFSGNLS